MCFKCHNLCEDVVPPPVFGYNTVFKLTLDESTWLMSSWILSFAKDKVSLTVFETDSVDRTGRGDLEISQRIDSRCRISLIEQIGSGKIPPLR